MVVSITEIQTPRNHNIVTIEAKTVISMYKATFTSIIAVAIYLLVDPGMQYLAKLCDLKFEEIAAAITLLSIPWMSS